MRLRSCGVTTRAVGGCGSASGGVASGGMGGGIGGSTNCETIGSMIPMRMITRSIARAAAAVNTPTHTLTPIPCVQDLSQLFTQHETIVPTGWDNISLSNMRLSMYDLQERKVYLIEPPKRDLSDIVMVRIRSAKDIKKIPRASGAYFIVTNEPVKHMFRSPSVVIPDPLPDGRIIIYNGITDNLPKRAEQHLLRNMSRGMSGISVDLLMGEQPDSHTKRMWASQVKVEKRKLPYVRIRATGAQSPMPTPVGPASPLSSQRMKAAREFNWPMSREDVLDGIHLSEEEQEFIRVQPEDEDLYFCNGINVRSAKHAPYDWYFAYCVCTPITIRAEMEKEWRARYGTPQLCSYMEGR